MDIVMYYLLRMGVSEETSRFIKSWLFKYDKDMPALIQASNKLIEAFSLRPEVMNFIDDWKKNQREYETILRINWFCLEVIYINLRFGRNASKLTMYGTIINANCSCFCNAYPPEPDGSYVFTQLPSFFYFRISFLIN